MSGKQGLGAGFGNYCATVFVALAALAAVSAQAQAPAADAPAVAPQAAAAPDKPAAAKPPPDPNRWEKSIAALEQAAQAKPPPEGAVLFVGSSTTVLWRKRMANDFPELNVIDHGFGGSQIADSVRYADRIVIPFKPAIVVLYAGGNDLNGGKTPEKLFADCQAFVAKVQAALPETTIAVISLNPTRSRAKDDAGVRAYNKLVQDYVQGKPKLAFIDSYSKMLAPDGKGWRDELLRKDGIHLSELGYDELAKIVKPELMRLAAAYPSTAKKPAAPAVQ